MKLESLKSSKFEAFKGSELQNLIAIKGGLACNTTFRVMDSGGNIIRSGTDVWEYGPDRRTGDDFHWNERGDMSYTSSQLPEEGDEVIYGLA